ncbi:MAG: metalloregulator ArsR/SmtB family transcription factor [Candidatus Krumholzibacteria bacterium]|nr:metalloregulator ArsR/SmtB family transcription factor [Candidatus Krumholzibacteria bacterium]
MIADPTRRAILELLATDAMHVSALTQHFGISRPAVSRHLRVLSQANLVAKSRVGRKRFYSLRPRQLQEVRMWIARFDRLWGVKLKNLKSDL